MVWVALLLGWMAMGLFIPIPFLFLGARMAGREWIGRRQLWGAWFAVLVIGGASSVIQVALSQLDPDHASSAPMLWLGLAVALLGAALLLRSLKRIFRTTLRGALLVWSCGLFGAMAYQALGFWVVNRYLFELKVMPTFAMAPTLLGPHHEAPCPECRGTAFVRSPSDDPRPSPLRGSKAGVEPHDLMICGACGRTSYAGAAKLSAERPGDRFLVDKLSQPGRWDVIVYHVPEDPGTLYAKRLVGLPGERVAIRGGKVWIDGRRVDPPPHVARLAYTSEPGRAYWRAFTPGAKEVPAGAPMYDAGPPPEDPGAEWPLGADAYFVLGDFSERSKDSRVADPRSPITRRHIVGVVRYIYWPPRRWGDVE